MKRYSKARFFISALSISLLLVVLVLSSYALFSSSQKSEKTQIVRTGDLVLSYLNIVEDNSVTLVNSVPLTYALGMAQTPITLSIENTGDKNLEYEIILVDDKDTYESTSTITYDSNGDIVSNNSLSHQAIRYAITSGSNSHTNLLGNEDVHCSNDNINDITCLSNNTYESGRIIYTDSIAASTTKNYNIRVWLNYNAGNEYQNKKYYAKLRVNILGTGTTSSSTIVNEEDSCFTFNNHEITGYDVNCGGINVNIPTAYIGVGALTYHLNTAECKSQYPEVVQYVPTNCDDDPGNIMTVVGITHQSMEQLIASGVITVETGTQTINVTGISATAFNNKGIVSVVIPSTITHISSGAFRKSTTSNPNLDLIINKTSLSFDWGSITGTTSNTFVTGVLLHPNGTIEIAS